jgi:hypothetical protein
LSVAINSGCDTITALSPVIECRIGEGGTMSRRLSSHFSSNILLSESLWSTLLALAVAFLSLTTIGNVQGGVGARASGKLQEQDAQEITTLKPGNTIERGLAGGQKHSYQITLSQGQYVRVEVKQHGIGIGMSIQLPGSKPIPVIDPPE